MADSNRTKKALAAALKELMQEKTFDKISVSDICDKCDMNRKSFYYHFRDKYDLVNWIFDTELISVMKNKTEEDAWEWYTEISEYFYENKAFYRKALRITGQNSFSDHFRDVMFYFISKRLGSIFGMSKLDNFQSNFFTDAIVLAFQRWMIEDSNMSAEEFVNNIKECLRYMAIRYDDFQ